MTEIPVSFPTDEQLFTGRRKARFLAVALESVVQDMSPVGDPAIAKQLGGYSLGETPPPKDAPEYVELQDGHLTLSNPPFLMAEIDITENSRYILKIRCDSNLKLLIDPPVRVTIEGSLTEVVEALEQMIAEIYQTKGRRLEMIDAGTIDPKEFTERR